MRRHRDRRFAGTALCSGAFALLLCAIVDGVMRAIVSPFPSPVVLLDDAAEIRAEHVAADSAFKRDGLRKMSALRVEAHKVEGNPDVHILKHEDRTLSAIKRLGSTKGMHLDLAPMSTGSSVSGGGDRGSEGGFLPGRHERAPTTVAAVARIARKAGVKISASITKSEQAKAAAMVAALMSGAKPQVHKHVASKRATFHRKMKQALFDYKLYKGRKGHVATADAKPTSPLPAMLGLRGRTAGRDAGVDAVLNPAAAAAAKKAAFHAKMAAALLAYERYNAPEGSGAGGGEAGTQPVLPLAPGTQEQTSSANWDAQPEEPAQAVMPGTATREHSQPDMVVSGWGPGQALTGQSGRGAGGVDKKALTELVQRFCPGVMSPQLCVEAIANGSLPHPDATAQKPQRPRATPSLVVKIPSSAPHNHAGFVCGQTGCAPRHKGERGRAGGLGAFGSESGSDGGWGQQIMRQEQLTWGGGLGRGRGRYTCDQDGCSMKTGPYSRQAAERPDASGGGLECDETGCRVRARRRRRFRHGVLALGLRQVPDYAPLQTPSRTSAGVSGQAGAGSTLLDGQSSRRRDAEHSPRSSGLPSLGSPASLGARESSRGKASPGLRRSLGQDSARRRQLRRALVRLHKKTQGLVGHAVPTDPLRGALNGHGAVGGSETDALPGVSGYAVEALAKESGRRGGSGDALVGDGAGLQYHHSTVIDEGQASQAGGGAVPQMPNGSNDGSRFLEVGVGDDGNEARG